MKKVIVAVALLVMATVSNVSANGCNSNFDCSYDQKCHKVSSSERIRTGSAYSGVCVPKGW